MIIEPKVEKWLLALAKAVAVSNKHAVVDTQNGKASYRFDFKGTTVALGKPSIYYEFVDFFRDDQNPAS